MSAITCFMNEWPTRLLTGLPPSSRMTSGTAFEQIRLWTIGFTRVPREHRGREDRGGGGTRHDLAPIVDQHDAVGVAVEREPDAAPPSR